MSKEKIKDFYGSEPKAEMYESFTDAVVEQRKALHEIRGFLNTYLESLEETLGKLSIIQEENERMVKIILGGDDEN